MLDIFLTVVIKYLTKRLREELVSLGPQETVYRNGEGHGSVNVVHRSGEEHGSECVPSEWGRARQCEAAGHPISSQETQRDNAGAKFKIQKFPFFFPIWNHGSSQLKLFEMALTDMPRGVFLD